VVGIGWLNVVVGGLGAPGDPTSPAMLLADTGRVITACGKHPDEHAFGAIPVRGGVRTIGRDG